MKQVVTILKQFEGNKDLKFKMQTLLKELFPFPFYINELFTSVEFCH